MLMLSFFKGVVIQDVNASESVCMERILDLASYPKMVPNVKSVQVYESQKFTNGSTRIGAQFDVGALGLGFRYYLSLIHHPKFRTLTWTLDYRYNSDFDDNVGHWQVMPHPKKKLILMKQYLYCYDLLFVCVEDGVAFYILPKLNFSPGFPNLSSIF